MQGHSTLEGLFIRLKPEALRPEHRTTENLTVHAQGGFGCRPDTIGSAVFVRFSDGDSARFERHHVERIATPAEAVQAGFTHAPTR